LCRVVPADQADAVLNRPDGVLDQVAGIRDGAASEAVGTLDEQRDIARAEPTREISLVRMSGPSATRSL
jgi:hypothetical protein